MQTFEKPAFGQMLSSIMASYGKPLPTGVFFQSWWDELQAFPMPVIVLAFADYRNQQADFAPHPNAIRKLCREHDGRPGVEEAWAIAITSQDEAETVVWTAECAEAFALCQPVLQMGDEVGARMAFKEAYNRIVSQARQDMKPAQWLHSLGWDVRKREAALNRAATAGLLPAPHVAALLPPPADAPKTDSNATAQIAKIKQMMADMQAEKEREFEAHQARQRNETAEAKARANAMTANYKAQGDAA
jgi:Sec-independent protein translocase protein TatA